MVRYALVDQPQTGDVLLAPGPEPLSWRRTEHERSCGVGSNHRTGEREAYRVRALAALLQIPEAELGVSARPHLDLAWTDGAAFTDAIAAERGRLDAAWQALGQVLKQAGRIEDMPPLALRIAVTDLRSAAAPLPDLSRWESPGGS